MKTFTVSILMAATQAMLLKDDEPPSCVPPHVADEILEQCDSDNEFGIFIDHEGEERDCSIPLELSVCSGPVSDSEGSGDDSPPSCVPAWLHEEIMTQCNDSLNEDYEFVDPEGNVRECALAVNVPICEAGSGSDWSETSVDLAQMTDDDVSVLSSSSGSGVWCIP